MLRRTAICLIAVCAGTSIVNANPNRIINPSAETGNLDGWTDALGHGFTVSGIVTYSGSYAFWGGATGPNGPYQHELMQDIDVTDLALQIDAGEVEVFFTGAGRSSSSAGTADRASIIVEYRSGTGTVIDSYETGDIVPFNAWQLVADKRNAPPGCRSVRVRLLARRNAGGSTDAYLDDLSLIVTTCQPGGPRVEYADSLDSRGTFLRTNNDPAQPSTILRLASMGVAPGDSVDIGLKGDFSFIGSGPEDDIGTPTIALFSATNELLSDSSPHRIPGALPRPPGTDETITLPTFDGGLPTDIPEDFQVHSSTVVEVPAGAQYLFICASDEFYSDNEDPDADYGYCALLLEPCPNTPVAVPEPTLGFVHRPIWLNGNPSGTEASIGFQISHPQTLVIDVFSVTGTRVDVILAGHREAGAHELHWNARDLAGQRLPTGTYFLSLRALSGGFLGSTRLTLIR